jgi:hypothetical protein
MPFCSAQRRSAMIIAAAPLLSPGAFPAVIVPSLRKAGFSLPRLSSVVSGRLCSSLAKLSGPLRPLISTATISASNLPAACAAEKRFWERSAHRSCWSRLIWYFVAKSSVCQPEC